MFATLLTSSAVRKAIGETIITWFSQFTQFESAQQGGDDTSDFVERDWSLGYTPEGFELLDYAVVGTTKLFMYLNSNGAMIDFTYNPSGSSVSVDNEDREYRTIVEGDIVYHIFELTDETEYKKNIVVWDMAGYRFTVMGTYDVDELMKTALSVE
jgi:hypothetical protein